MTSGSETLTSGRETQRLMLVGHDRGSSVMASMLVEMVKGMMQSAG